MDKKISHNDILQRLSMLEIRQDSLTSYLEEVDLWLKALPEADKEDIQSGLARMLLDQEIDLDSDLLSSDKLRTGLWTALVCYAGQAGSASV